MTTLYIIRLSFVLLWFSILEIKFLRKNKYINSYESLAKILGFIFTFATLISLQNLQTKRPTSTQASVHAFASPVLQSIDLQLANPLTQNTNLHQTVSEEYAQILSQDNLCETHHVRITTDNYVFIVIRDADTVFVGRLLVRLRLTSLEVSSFYKLT